MRDYAIPGVDHKYGVSSQVVPSVLGEVVGGKDVARSNRVMQALMRMTKLDIAKLEAAAAGRSGRASLSRAAR
jgi:predicted 3-demethylubiquinone-9 3-methyltransferase (glyoxalase superfamily)